MTLATRPPRLVAVATHPIQYHAPLFRRLAQRADLDFEVAYLELLDDKRQGQGFGVEFQWDVPLLDGYRWRVLPTRRLYRSEGFFARRIPAARAVLRELEADVVLLTGWQSLSLLQLLFAARAIGLPTLMRGDSNALRSRGPLVRSLHRRLLARIGAFLAVGTANRNFYLANGVAPSKLFNALHFVDNDAFAAQAQRWRTSRADLRREFAVPSESLCFLFAGKFERKKHPEHILEALSRVRARNPQLAVHALMVGAGALDGQLRARVERDRLPVSFTGFLNQGEIAKAYVAADALVLPSDYGETWGLVVNEAMACGLPAIVSDRVGCGPDLVVPGVTGQVFPFGEVEGLAGIFAEWAASPQSVREMGRAAERRVRDEYTVQAATDGVAAAAFSLARPPGLRSAKSSWQSQPAEQD